jgi:hypothetical protein
MCIEPQPNHPSIKLYHLWKKNMQHHLKIMTCWCCSPVQPCQNVIKVQILDAGLLTFFVSVSCARSIAVYRLPRYLLNCTRHHYHQYVRYHPCRFIFRAWSNATRLLTCMNKRRNKPEDQLICYISLFQLETADCDVGIQPLQPQCRILSNQKHRLVYLC